jgi:lauroyl/myristoyl acyltransferase
MPNTIKEGVDTMNKELEKCIMLAPEQYAWEYKKYRRAGNENHYK